MGRSLGTRLGIHADHVAGGRAVWGVATCRMKLPLQDFVLKMQGELMCKGWGGIFAGHYSTSTVNPVMTYIHRHNLRL